jgi:hypothetical protein
MEVIVDDLEHDNFIISLGDYQKQFVKTKLDTSFQEGKNQANNLNLREVQDALLARSRTRGENKR